MFRRAARKSGYKGRTLVEEFKWGINSNIRCKLMKTEQSFLNISKWFNWAISLDRNQREQKRKRNNKRKERDPSTKAKHPRKCWRSIMAIVTTVPSMIKKVGVSAGPTSIEGVERINALIAYPQQQQVGFMPKYNTYAIEIDRGRNCYNYGKFRHITRHYKNQRFMEQERRMEYKHNHNTDNLKKEENLVVLD